MQGQKRRTIKHHAFTILVTLGMITLGALLVSCSGSDMSPTSTPFPTLTPAPSKTPTAMPPGTLENPLTIGVVGNPGDPDLMLSCTWIAEQISQGVGIPTICRIVPNYTLLLHEMSKSKVHVASLPPATYLYADKIGLADARLIFNRFGLYATGTQFFIHKNSGLLPYYDEIRQMNAASAEIALAQLQGKRPCWTAPNSISGYLLPAGLLEQQGIQTQEPVFTYTASATIRALYITGICDFGATFALSGDPRTSEAVITDLTDVKERIPVLWQSDGIIPNPNISFHPELPADMANSVLTSLLVLSETTEGKEALSRLMGFEIGNLLIIDDAYYEPLREILTEMDEWERFIGS